MAVVVGSEKSAFTLRSRRRTLRRVQEAPIYVFLFACAALSIATTLGIILTLVEETVHFFGEVSLIEFFFTTHWAPQFPTNQGFGVIPLLNATFFIAFLSMLVALPLGVLVAIYLSEYAHPRLRSIVKPILEILAGIPTVVYGYFALTFITPDLLRTLFGSEVSITNALAGSMAIGVMILPLIASLSEDAMRAVPQSLREGAYGLGATRFEVAVKVVFPAALSGIIAAVILAMSRAAGETMIVAMASGLQPNLSWNPFEGMATMTAYIVNVSLGDTQRGTIEYNTIFAVGMLLFVCTLALNVIAQWVLSKFREVYD